MSTVSEFPSTRPGGWDDPGAAPIPAPLRLYEATVRPQWVDYNGHMSEWCYLLVMGDSSDAFFRYVGIDDAYRAAGRSLYTVETHLRNLREVAEGDRLDAHAAGARRRRQAGAPRCTRCSRSSPTVLTLVATGEQMLLHVDAAGRARPCRCRTLLHERVGRAARRRTRRCPAGLRRAPDAACARREASAWTSS